MNAMIECHDLSKLYEEQCAVNHVSFIINEQEFLSILGPSGCGKSTLLRLVAGLEKPDCGSVLLRGKNISGQNSFLAPEYRKFGMVFQDFSLFPHLSISANIAYGVKGSRAEKQARVVELLELVNLPDSADKMPHQISGGEQQRVAVARALAPRPRLLLMDEPFSNLDYKLRIQLRREIRTILKKEGVATILVTHDQSEAITFSDRVLIMQDGNLIQTGEPAEIYQYPKTLWAASFVGEANHLTLNWENKSLILPFDLSKKEQIVNDKIHTLMVRPEDFQMDLTENENFNGIIEFIEFSGSIQTIDVRLKGGAKVQVSDSPHANWKKGNRVNLCANRFLCYDQAGLRIDF